MEFVIYTGSQPGVTIYRQGMSKAYKLEKDVPMRIESSADRPILLNYIEGAKKSCCGKGRTMTRPVVSDVTYCKMRRLSLTDFREYWSNE